MAPQRRGVRKIKKLGADGGHIWTGLHALMCVCECVCVQPSSLQWLNFAVDATWSEANAARANVKAKRTAHCFPCGLEYLPLKNQKACFPPACDASLQRFTRFNKSQQKMFTFQLEKPHLGDYLCDLPVGSLNTALASALVWMMLFSSTAMLGTLFLGSCLRAAWSKEEKKKKHLSLLLFRERFPVSTSKSLCATSTYLSMFFCFFFHS